MNAARHYLRDPEPDTGPRFPRVVIVGWYQSRQLGFCSGSRGREFSDMSNVPRTYRTDLRRERRHERDGFTGKCQNLDFVTRVVTVNVYDGADIAGLEPFVTLLLHTNVT